MCDVVMMMMKKEEDVCMYVAPGDRIGVRAITSGQKVVQFNLDM